MSIEGLDSVERQPAMRSALLNGSTSRGGFVCSKVIQVTVVSAQDQPFDAEVSLLASGRWGAMDAGALMPSPLLRLGETHGTDSVAILIRRIDTLALLTARNEVSAHADRHARLPHTELSAWVGVMLPANVIAPLIRHVGEDSTPFVPRDKEALALLVQYIDILKGNFHSLSAALRSATLTHILDLVAMALGPASNSAVTSTRVGLRAARLQALKTDILQNLTSRDLSLASLAQRHGISRRYVQMMLEAEGLSFSGYVLEQRLCWAHRLIADPLYRGWKITAVVAEVGLGDLSYFNRAFRRRFGMTPSEARRQALFGQGEAVA